MSAGAVIAPLLSHSFFKTVVETVNEGIWMIGLDGRTTFANDRMAAMLGVSTESMLGRHPAEFLLPQDLPMAQRVIDKSLGGEPEDFDPRFLHSDGSEVPTLGSAAPVRGDDGRIIGSVATFSDLRARKAAEQAVDLRTQEFQALADNIPALCWMAYADGHIYWYNKRWYEYTGASLETQEGWGWESVHDPAILPAVIEKWKASLSTGEPFEMTFPLRGADGIFRPFLTRVVPVRGEDGSISRWFGSNTDVDALQRAQAELEANRAQLATQIAELEALYASAPIGLGFFSRDYRYLKINDELAAINGVPADAHLGRTIAEILPVNAPFVEPIIDQVFATGQAVANLEVSGETPQQPGVERHWLTGFYPVQSEGGAVEAVGAWVVEITERKAAEQRELLLAREVDHRAKNLLAVVQSIVTLSPGTDGAEMKSSVVGRIQALARAHSLLSDSRWDGVDLGTLVDEELAPFASRARGRIHTGGPPLKLRPTAAQSLALVLHELATNAAKYGALSVDTGALQVEWRREQDETGTWLVIEWSESGGPPVAAPDSFSFGSNIIRASVERQLRGKVFKDWRPEGLVCILRIPSAEAVPGPES